MQSLQKEKGSLLTSRRRCWSCQICQIDHFTGVASLIIFLTRTCEPLHRLISAQILFSLFSLSLTECKLSPLWWLLCQSVWNRLLSPMQCSCRTFAFVSNPPLVHHFKSFQRRSHPFTLHSSIFGCLLWVVLWLSSFSPLEFCQLFIIGLFKSSFLGSFHHWSSLESVFLVSSSFKSSIASLFTVGVFLSSFHPGSFHLWSWLFCWGGIHQLVLLCRNPLTNNTKPFLFIHWVATPISNNKCKWSHQPLRIVLEF